MTMHVSAAALARGGHSTRVAAWCRDLYPGSFALTMASGIVSTGLLRDAAPLSWLLFAVALGGFGVLSVALIVRAAAYRDELRRDVLSPARTFGFFTFSAAANVLAARCLQAHWDGAAWTFLVVGSVAWLVLTYGIPVVLMLEHRDEPVLPQVNGGWLIWVVSTQSVAAVAALAAAMGGGGEAGALALRVAVVTWGVGVALYLVLITLILTRLLLLGATRPTLTPPYWIAMGATAISVLAGARILAVANNDPLLAAAAPGLRSISFILWSFGTWWIPMLVLLGLWRYARGQRAAYEPALWSMVFPLGMYAEASREYGAATGVDFLAPLARVAVWIGFAVWCVVFAGMLVSVLRPVSAGRRRMGAPGTGSDSSTRAPGA